MRSRRRRFSVRALLIEPLAMKLRGFPIGGRLIVRCRRGHLFTTIWIPSFSLKAARLLWWRGQYCPVGRHWSVVVPVSRSRADRRREAERARTARHTAAVTQL